MIGKTTNEGVSKDVMSSNSPLRRKAQSGKGFIYQLKPYACKVEMSYEETYETFFRKHCVWVYNLIRLLLRDHSVRPPNVAAQQV